MKRDEDIDEEDTTEGIVLFSSVECRFCLKCCTASSTYCV